MKHIKNTLKLYVLDWKRIFKNPIATLLILALMIIPSLYAWFNIKALWDPYGNTGELPIAVYSADKPAEFQGKQVEIGKEVIKNLHENKQLGWQFVDSKADLDEGVKSGKYYAGIYLPADFSKDLLSFTTGEIHKPKIEYSVNEKINAIAPKITEKGASSLQAQISDEFTKTASSTLVKVFNEIGYNIDANLLSINKVKNMILSTDDNLDKIDGYTKEVIELQEKMPELKEKLNKANEFVDYIPEVDAMGDKLVALNDKMPELKKQAAIILDLQKKIPEIQNAGKQLAMIDEDFDKIESTMSQGIDSAKKGIEIIGKVQDTMPEIQKFGNQADQIAGSTKEFATQLQSVLPTITSSVQTTLESVLDLADLTVNTAQKIKDYAADNELTPEERTAIKALLSALDKQLTFQQKIVGDLLSFITNLNEKYPSDGLADAITKLTNVQTLLQGLQSRLAAINVDKISSADLQKAMDDIIAVGQEVRQVIQTIQQLDISGQVSQILTQLITGIDTAQDLLAKVDYDELNNLLASTKDVVKNAVAILEKYQKEMPAIKKELHDANTMLNGHMNEIVAGINKGVDLYNNELPVVEEKLGLAADFIQNDWPTLKTEITTTLNTVNDKMPQVETALNAAVDLIQNDWPTIKSGLHKAADAIRKGEKEVDLAQVIKLLKLDANKESDFFTQPVEVSTKELYPIANNGSASTPFYTALCLWVGAVLFSSVATTDFFLEGDDKKRYSKREQFGARMLTFLTMGLAQALIVTLGNYFLLGVDVRAPFYSVLFALLIALAFMMMVYVLVALFGNVGKGIAIIILVLSISGGGGNYPIQVSGKFFQMINPFLPFTHAVNLLRESAGGIYWPNATTAIWIMVGIFVVFGVLGTWLYPYISEQTKKLAKVSHESHLFH